MSVLYVNLLFLCEGPIATYNSFYGKYQNHTDELSEFITTIILKSPLSLVTPGTTGIKNANMVSMLSYLLTSKSQAHLAQVLF